MQLLEWLMLQSDYPLYYDAMNEKGRGNGRTEFCRKCCLCRDLSRDVENIAQFEFIPWILSTVFFFS